MGFNDYLGPLVNVEGATSIGTILLVDVDVGSFSPYKYVPTPWAKHTKTTVMGALSLGNPSCSKLDFSPPHCRRRAAQRCRPAIDRKKALGEFVIFSSCSLCSRLINRGL